MLYLSYDACMHDFGIRNYHCLNACRVNAVTEIIKILMKLFHESFHDGTMWKTLWSRRACGITPTIKVHVTIMALPILSQWKNITIM